jgi:hypothetical protein
MTPDQMKTARLLLGWSIPKLGIRSGTSPYMVKTYEQTGRVILPHVRTKRDGALAAVRVTLEAAGIDFTNGDEPGVKLRATNSCFSG